MKKKLLLGCIVLPFFLCLPYFNLKLSSDFTETAPVNAALSPAPEPEPEAEPAPEPLPEPAPAAAPDSPDAVVSIPSSVGTLTYYNQHDPRWADALYGGNDSVSSYGCGPTVLAMLVSSFTEQTMTPDAMAQWAAANYYWASGSGSRHNLIPEGAAAFGFRADSFQDFTPEGVKTALRKGSILVALMGPGHFTSSGHFIIIADYWSGNLVSVADPASLENTQIPWDIQLILNELNTSHIAGGPVWSVSPH